MFLTVKYPLFACFPLLFSQKQVTALSNRIYFSTTVYNITSIHFKSSTTLNPIVNGPRQNFK